MTADIELDANAFELFCQVEVIQDRCILGEVVHEHAALPCLQAAEPLHAFPGDECGSHAHVRAAAAAQEAPSLDFEIELFVAEYLLEGVASAF